MGRVRHMSGYVTLYSCVSEEVEVSTADPPPPPPPPAPPTLLNKDSVLRDGGIHLIKNVKKSL
jgi:hypothetical protein